MPNCLNDFLAHPDQADAFVEDFLGMELDEAVDVERFLAKLKTCIAQQQSLTPQLFRQAATHSALNSFFGRLEADFLEPFYCHGIISLKTAIIAAQSQSLDFDTCDALVAIAPHLGPQQLETAIATVENLKDDYRRQMALAGLYPYLEESIRTEKVVALYPQLVSKQHSSELHVRYWPLLPQTIRHGAILTALDKAITMQMPMHSTAEYLLRIIPWLAELSQDELCRWLLKYMMAAQLETSGETLERLQNLELSAAIEEVAIITNNLALKGFHRLYNSAERSYLAVGTIGFLPEDAQSDAIVHWLNTLYESNKPENQAGGLAGLAPYLDGDVRTTAIADAWAIAKQIDSIDKRALLMTMIAQQMPASQMPEKMREALRDLGSYRYMSASKAILNTLSSFPKWGVKLILEQEYRYSQHIDDDLYIRVARVAFNPHHLPELIDDAVLDQLLDWWMPACQLSETPLLKHILDVLPEPQRTTTIKQIVDRSTAELAARALAFSLRTLLPHTAGHQQHEILQRLTDAVWQIGEKQEYMHRIAVYYGRPSELSYLVGLTDESARLKTANAAFSAMIALAKDNLNNGPSSAYATDCICEDLKRMLPYLDESAADLLLDTANVGLPDYVYWPVAAILFSSVSMPQQEKIRSLIESDELCLSRRDELPIVHGSIKARGEALAWRPHSDNADELQDLLSDLKRLPAKLRGPLFCDWVAYVDKPLRTQFLHSAILILSELEQQSDIDRDIIRISTRLPALSLAEDRWLCTQVLIQAANLRRKEFLDTLHNLKPRLVNCDMLESIPTTLDLIHQQFPSLDKTFKFELW